MAHPDEQTRCIVPHLVLPGFVHAAHVLQVDELGLLAELLQRLRRTVAFVDRAAVVHRTGIRCFLAEEMVVPHIVVFLLQLLICRQRPQLVGRDEEFHALVLGEGGHAYLRTHAVAIGAAIGIGRFIECQVTG